MSKFIARMTGTLVALAPLTTLAQSYDDYYYDDYSTISDSTAAGLGIALILIWAAIMLVGVAFLIFWVIMLIDCIKRDFEQKNVWLIILIASLFLQLSWLAAIVYYFMVKRKKVASKVAPVSVSEASEPKTTEEAKK